MTSKLISHNMTFKGIEAVPGVMDYDQRGIVFAQRGDIVLTHQPPESSYLAYLQTLEYPVDSITFISPPKKIPNRNYTSIFTNKSVITQLKKLVSQSANNYVLDDYIPSVYDQKLARLLNIKHCNNAPVSLRYGTKSGFRVFAQKANLPYAQGFKNLTSPRQIQQKIIYLFKTGLTKIVAKIDDGISGYGNLIFTAPDHQSELSALSPIKFRQKYLDQIRWGQVKQAVVESWIEGGINSPSILIYLTPQGSQIYCLQDQLLEHGDKWAGCYFPSTLLKHKQKYKQLMDIIDKSNQFLRAKNFWGYYSFDILETKTQLFAIEANMRKIGSFYGRAIANHLRSHSLLKKSTAPYVVSDYRHDRWIGQNFSVLSTCLNQLLWNKHTQTGVIPYNVKALDEGGRFDFVILAPTPDQAIKLREKIISHLNTYRLPAPHR